MRGATMKFMFMYCLYLPGYSTSLIPCHWKTVLAWQFIVANNNKVYFGLHVKCPTFLPDFNHICSISTDIHKFPYTEFHAGVFRDHAHAPNKRNYISIHLYAVMERGWPTLPFTFQIFIPCQKPHLLL